MKRNIKFLLFLSALNLFAIVGFSQAKVISGNIIDSSTNRSVPAVSVTVKGTGEGTYTNEKGYFSLEIHESFPVTLVASSIGYHPQEITVKNQAESLTIVLSPASTLGQEIVVSATRTPSRILESPVTIERINAIDIRNSAQVSYYDMISQLKGVDVVNASLTFSSPTTRGFAGSGNARLNQIVDGMDNQAPGLNFSVGNIIGLTELDVASVELLPGASSALYGPGGMNGAIIINSKDPFRYQGLSLEAKSGLMNIDNKDRGASPYYNFSLRWAKKISEKFAFKTGGEFIQAKDWVANDYRDYDRVSTNSSIKKGTRDTDPNYDGINVYGDETTADIRTNVLDPLASAAPFYAPYIHSFPASMPVSRTGYLEKNILNPNTVNVKLFGEASYKLSQNTSLNAEGFWGTGNTVYTGADRFSLLNFKIGQYKIELVNKHWFLRAYTTQENAGQTYNATVTTRLVNEAWKPSGGSNGWYAQYAMAFLNAKLAGQTDIAAYNSARAVADEGRPEPGSNEFKELFDKVRSIPISKGGGLFVDKTDLYNFEGQYDLSAKTSKVADLLVGGNFKKYVLNSEGTLFADSTEKIPINEFGAYIQANKKIFNDRLKLIASGRYDKNENFDGRFTPRFSAVVKVAEDNNIRLSYQQAYRFGSTQQQWINLRVGGGTALIGGLQTLKDYYHFSTNPVYAIDNNLFAGSPQVQTFQKFKAETVNSFEAGYKGLLLKKRLLVDLYGYYGVYHDFIARTLVAQSVNGDKSVLADPATVKSNLNNPQLVTTYSVPINVKGSVNTYGLGLGLTYSLPDHFLIGANISSDHLDKVPDNFVAGFNAPDYRWGATFSNDGFGKQGRYGFNVAYHFQDDVNYQGDFSNGTVPAFQTLDAQVSYKFPAVKILLKLGGTNILNQYYRNGFGNPAIGGLYYASIGYNLF